MMKCIFLAAGYATRLYPLTENFPKPLLKIKGKTIIDWLIDDLEIIGIFEQYVVVTNNKFYCVFQNWKNNHKYKGKIILVNDGTNSNETRLGAVKDLNLAVKILKLNEDLFVMASDNILDFSLKGFVDFSITHNYSCVMTYEELDENNIRKTASVELDVNHRVTKFIEKPINISSCWCCPPFYFYKKHDLSLLDSFVISNSGIDAPGHFAAYVQSKSQLYAYKMPGKRYDIGDMESYNKVNEK